MCSAVLLSVCVRQQPNTLTLLHSKCECTVPPSLVSLVKECYGDFNSGNADLSSFGPIVPGTGQRMYRYITSKQLGCTIGCGTVGTVANYPGGGFSIELPSSDDTTTQDVVRAKLLSVCVACT